MLSFQCPASHCNCMERKKYNSKWSILSLIVGNLAYGTSQTRTICRFNDMSRLLAATDCPVPDQHNMTVCPWRPFALHMISTIRLYASSIRPHLVVSSPCLLACLPYINCKYCSQLQTSSIKHISLLHFISSIHNHPLQRNTHIYDMNNNTSTLR